MKCVGESEANSPDVLGPRIRQFAEILNPLFWNDEFNKSDRLFEFVCTLVRAAGLESSGWDSHEESLAFLEDMRRLSDLDLSEGGFPDPDLTKARLALVSYCHVTEMDVPYELLANLLRLRLGGKYAIHPFRHLTKPQKQPKKGKGWGNSRPPSPEAKIKEIERLATEAQVPQVGEALRGIYDSVIRNAVYHSDYVLHDESMRLLSSYRKSKETNMLTKIIHFGELMEFINDAFAFYSALIALYGRACRSFRNFHNSMLPFDGHYKGLLELTFDGDELTGFRAYWPNGSLSIYCRSKVGCTANNIIFDPDGSINFMVGMFARVPGQFSPCVERDAKPIYVEVPGTKIRPHWPKELKAYTLS
jgi:hypothetical protein